MTSISSGSVLPPSPPQSNTAPGATPPTGTASTSPGVNPAALMQAQSILNAQGGEKVSPGMQEALLSQIQKTLGTLENKGDGVKNAQGAPNIAEPNMQLSADDLVALLQHMRSKSQDQQLATAKLGLERSRVDAQKNNEAQQKKIQEWINKCQEEANKSQLSKIFGWIGKIFAVIAAVVAIVASVVATPFTGGAAAALTALAVVGLVAATMSLADQISQASGGPEISLSNMMTKMVGGILEAMGVPKEKAEQIGRTMAGALAMMMPVALLVEPKLLGTMVQGIAQLAGADAQTTMALTMGFTLAAALVVGIGTAVVGFNAAKAVSDVTNQVMKTATALSQAVAQGVTGATQIAQGAIGIEKGKLAEEGEKALADKKELEAFLKMINQSMEDQREALRKLIQELEEGVKVVSSMVQSAADSMSQITSNLGKRQAAV